MSTIKDYAALINGWIKDLKYPQKPQGLYEPIAYMLCGGGKRLRPTLLCASAEAFGLDCNEVKSQALGIEMFHNFTLLHDDVMDNADVRHGMPTVHRKWNVSTAILSGDTMLTLANRLMGECNAEHVAEVLDIFNKTAVEIYEGQQYDMNFENREDVTLEEYVEMIRLKTAVLLGCACHVGALLAGGSVDDCLNMYKFGEQMGLAFQLRDDYLDTFGDVKTFGKEIGGDILNDKKTWLRIKTASCDGGRLATLTSTTNGTEKIEAVTNLYKELSIDESCMREVERYTTNAIKCLDNVSISDDFKQYFINIAVSAIKRNH